MNNKASTFLTGLAGTLLLLLQLSVSAAPPRNVLFIAVDDLRTQLGCYGHSEIKSPHIDRLAASGLLFERAYCQQAVCAPSRASLLSGLRPDSTGVHDLKHPLRETKPDVRTLPQHFHENGYETVSLGKIYHHRGTDNGIGWSSPAWHPQAPADGTWKGRGYLTPEARALVDTGPRKGVGVGPAYEAAEVPDDAYPDGAIARKAVETIARLKTGDKPFFLAVGFIKPHLPFNAPKRYWDLYDPKTISVSPQRDYPVGMPAFASSGWGELKGYVGIPREKQRLTDELSVTLIHGYNACVSYTDALVGQVLAALDRQGLRDSTVVILWGDHGWKLSEYSAWCKHTNFELDTHVPMILSVPGRGIGKRTSALVEFVDIYPTLAELCGLAIPPHCEGTSMVRLLDNPDRDWKTASFSQYPRGRNMGYTMRCANWRYTEWRDRKSGQLTARELYDHTAGPLATRNLAGKPERKDLVDRLSRLLNKGQGWTAMQAQE